MTNATDLSMAEVAALNGRIAAVETTVSDVRMAIAEGLAKGMRVSMAIGPDSTRAAADGNADDNQLPFMIDDLMMSASTPAGIGGWTGAIYTRAMGMVTDRVVS